LSCSVSLFQSSVHRRDLHPFPTRRSSDLTQTAGADQQAAVLTAEAREVTEKAIQAHDSVGPAAFGSLYGNGAGRAQAGLVTLLGRQALQRGGVDLRAEAPAGFIAASGCDAALVGLAA